jgi:hypothetical protein
MIKNNEITKNAKKLSSLEASLEIHQKEQPNETFEREKRYLGHLPLIKPRKINDLVERTAKARENSKV